MLKKSLFQLHWFFGITAGLVLALMGITGATVSFQDELMRLVNPGTLTVTVQPQGVLAPSQLIARLGEQDPKPIAGLLVKTDGKAARVFYKPEEGERRGPMAYFDPFTGQLLGDVRGEDFFGLMLQLHRFLAMGETGRQITGASTLALLFFCVSGLYLRWPRRPLDWRAWLRFDFAKRGRAFHWDLHAVAGTWCLVFYLWLGLTGLWWSYDWYREGLTRLVTGEAAEQRHGGGGGRGGRGGPEMARQPETAATVDLDAVWHTLLQVSHGKVLTASLQIPQRAGQPMDIFYVGANAPHERAFSILTVDAQTGALKRHQPFEAKPLGARLLGSMYDLHTGSYFGLIGRILVTAASLSMPLFAITGWWLYLDRRRKKKAIAAQRQDVTEGDDWLIGYASQSGQAERLAWQSARHLQAAGLGVKVRCLSKLEPQSLQQTRQALFVVSTFGDGEAPDSARGFERQVLGHAMTLSDLRFGLLALGDRQYQDFCGFARRLAQWLDQRGARSAFSPVEVDNVDPIALGRWQAHLAELTGTRFQEITDEQPFTSWTLAERHYLNPGSQGAPVMHLVLKPQHAADWQAGDLVDILPPGLSPREARAYSIASIPSEGHLHLLVRLAFREDGSSGLCSGWLCQQLKIGDPVPMRLRRNAGFHLADINAPLIMIGNGTGLAGLRSLLRSRIEAGHDDNWLLFGERNRASDFHWQDELTRLLTPGRLDVAFSRDQAERVHVQQRLREAAAPLREWIARGAAVHVCGSLDGMAGGVDAVLRDVLGDVGVESLIAAGRYRRDVY